MYADHPHHPLFPDSNPHPHPYRHPPPHPSPGSFAYTGLDPRHPPAKVVGLPFALVSHAPHQNKNPQLNTPHPPFVCVQPH